jgi:integrase
VAKGIPKQDREAWEQRGGYVRTDAKGRAVFVIRKQIGGRRYEWSTRRHTLGAALAEWEKFERDPGRYLAAGKAPIILDLDLCKAFLRWSAVDRGNSDQWVEKQRSILAWWMGKLKGVDLRRATLLDDLLPPLKGAESVAQRTEVLKTLYGWLRKVERTITTNEDPTYGALPVTQARPAQRTKSKVIPIEHYLLVREHLVGPYRDALDVLAGTGWHVTEVVRFADGGVIEPMPKAMTVLYGAVAVLVCPLHKSGDEHRTAVSKDVLEAAKRLRARGWPDDSVFPFHQAIKSACLAVKLPVPREDGTDGIDVFTPGRFRHSVATWAVEKGADPAAVSAFLGHKSPATTKKFYLTLATIPKIPTLA